jgi:predicted nucleic acid-binding protein
MNTEKPGAVFDAMVFLQAMVSDQGPAFACQQLVDNGEPTLFDSPAVLEEVKDIANRPRVRQKFKNLTPEKVQAFPEDLNALAVPMVDIPHIFSYLRDPDDEPYININLAIAAGANYLVQCWQAGTGHAAGRGKSRARCDGEPQEKSMPLGPFSFRRGNFLDLAPRRCSNR